MRCFKYIVYLVNRYIMYEKNIVEIKNEYTTFLVNIITPLIYEGIKSVYNYSVETHQQLLEKAQNAKIENPGPLKIFQTCLKELPTLNQHQIEEEVKRIKEFSKCSEWFDDLVKSVIKSNIVLLTFSQSKDSDIIKDKYHDTISTSDFIHKCYIESARAIYNNPELFWHGFPTLEIKRNQRDACEIIKCAIHEAIRKMLPMKLILTEYLQNDYVPEDLHIGSKIPDSQYENVKSMVKKDMHGGHSSPSNSNRSKSTRSDRSNSSEQNGFKEIVSERSNRSDERVPVSETVNDLEHRLTNIGDKMQDQIFVAKEEEPKPIPQHKQTSIPKANEDPEIIALMGQGNAIAEPPARGGAKRMINRVPSQQSLVANKPSIVGNQMIGGFDEEKQQKMSFFSQYLK